MSKDRYTKQVIVIRNDLNMRKGKMVAQGSHASLSFLSRKLELNCVDKQCDIYRYDSSLSEAEHHWLNNSFVKICCVVESEEELIALHTRAIELGLVSHLIIDDGRTEFNGIRTKTCIAIGPDWCDKIDEVTKDLRLL